MPSALVLGGGFDQWPLVRSLRNRGYRCVLLDHAAHPVAAPDCDVHIRRSALDLHAVCAVARAESVSFIVSVAMDPAVPVIAEASAALELPTLLPPAASAAATSKVLMKQRIVAAGIATSRQVVISGHDLSAVADLQFPVVAKPEHGTGGRGVTAVDDMTDLPAVIAAIRTETGQSTVVVEEFTGGREVSVDCFTTGGETQLVCVSDLVGTAAARPGFAVIRCQTPADLTPEQLRGLQSTAVRLAEVFEITGGPWIFQAILNPSPWVVEVGARIAGGRKPRFVKVATGVDLLGAYIDDLAGIQPDLRARADATGATVTYVYGRAGVVAGYRGLGEALAGVEYLEVFKEAGARLTGGLSPRDRILEFCTPDRDSDHRLEREILQRIDCVSADGSSLIRRQLYAH